MPGTNPRTTLLEKRDLSPLSLENFLGLLVSLVALVCIYLSPASASLVGRELHTGILLPVVFCALAAVALRIRGTQFPIWSFAFVAGFVLLQLWWLWFAGVSDTMLVGGLLPFSDASDYLVNAQVLASGERIQGQGHANDHLLASAMPIWQSTHHEVEQLVPNGNPDELRTSLRALS